MAEVNKIADGKVEIKVTVEGEKWTSAQKKAFNKLAKNVEIKGFRKGQAPANMVRARLSEGAILAQAAEDIANDVFKDALKETGVELIDRADLDITGIDEAHVEFKFVCPVKPDVNLGEYKGLGYAPKEATVEDGEIQEQIDQILEQKADLEIKEEGAVEEGDTAVIDYEGFKDGVPFDGGKDENHELVIGSHTFIPGFEEGVIGMHSEETKDIELTFPEDYHVEELKGQKVIFKVTVHEIKRKVLPELNDELVQTLGLEEVKTPEDLKNYIKNSLLEGRKRQNEEAATNELLDKVTGNASVNIPDVMIEDEIDQILNEMDQDFQRQGFSLAQYMNILKMDMTKIRENFKNDAEKRVKLRLVLEEIAKVENIEVNDEDIDKEIDDLASKYQMKKEDISKMVDRKLIANDLRMQKALDLIKA